MLRGRFGDTTGRPRRRKVRRAADLPFDEKRKCRMRIVEMNEEITSFSPGVEQWLGHYVYLLKDPDTNKPFYVGRGQGDRLFSHIKGELKFDKTRDKMDLKTEFIHKLRRRNCRPIHIIHRHNLDENQAKAVESALIDYISDHISDLTNAVRGEGADYGPAEAIQLNRRYGEDLKPKHKLLYIKTKQETVDDPRHGNLYEAVRRSWVLKPERAKEADYVIAVIDQICRGVFEVHGDWYEGRVGKGKAKRYAFYGCEVTDPEIVDAYIDKPIPKIFRKKSRQNPICYGWEGEMIKT